MSRGDAALELPGAGWTAGRKPWGWKKLPPAVAVPPGACACWASAAGLVAAGAVITPISQISHTQRVTSSRMRESAGTRAARLPTSLHQLQSRCIGSRSAALSGGRGAPSGVRLLTVAIVQEVSDEAGTAGGPGLLGVHVSHHRGHDMVGGAPRPIQTHAWL